jgi:hypothetical protein
VGGGGVAATFTDSAMAIVCHTVGGREGGREGGRRCSRLYMLSASAVLVAWLLLRGGRAITTRAAPAPGPVLIMGVPVLHSLLTLLEGVVGTTTTLLLLYRYYVETAALLPKTAGILESSI